MADGNAFETAKANAVDKINALLEFKIKEAAVRPSLGDVNFNQTLPAIDRVLGLFSMLQNVSLDFVSQSKLSELAKAADEVANVFKQIEAFKLDIDSPKAQRDAIHNKLVSSYDNWFERVYPVVAFSVRSTTDFAALERDLRGKMANAEVTADSLLKQQQEALIKSNEALEAIRKAAAEAGVSQEAIHFQNEAREHSDTAAKWLRATAALGVLTIAWGALVIWYLQIPADAKIAQIVQQSLGKIIILAGLSYGMLLCARNYSASRNNFVVNRQRENSLRTFETFVKAASTEDVKQAVLLQATSAIFSLQGSGYTTKDGDTDQPSKMIEILRSASSATKAAS